ncbi:LysR substrate-binding domain-containing protein [Nocardia jiangsuensis]|uniref:LysR substrate-binding domain-containing protein n=1 Tax=Nocardia jiangsuensis TaxID=1691563 RepID=A0ABV8DNH0_9NOCA
MAAVGAGSGRACRAHPRRARRHARTARLHHRPAQRTVFHDDWVAVCDPDRTPDPPTADDLRRLPWVLVYNSQTASTPAARRLRMLGIEPRVQVVTESFLTVPGLVTGSARIALLPRRLLALPGMREGLHAHPCPVELGQLTRAMWWHPMLTDEPEHRFLRTLIAHAARELDGSGPPPARTREQGHPSAAGRAGGVGVRTWARRPAG